MIPTHTPLDFRGVALHPPENRRVIDVDAPLLHHFGEVSFAERVLAVPAHAQKDDLDGKAAALENGHRQQGSSVETRLIKTAS
jgi:hypothetical protein